MNEWINEWISIVLFLNFFCLQTNKLIKVEKATKKKERNVLNK